MPKIITNENKFIIELDENDKPVLKCSGIEFHGVVQGAIKENEKSCLIVLMVENFEICDPECCLEDDKRHNIREIFSTSDNDELIYDLLKKILLNHPELSIIKKWSFENKEHVLEWTHNIFSNHENGVPLEKTDYPPVLEDFIR